MDENDERGERKRESDGNEQSNGLSLKKGWADLRADLRWHPRWPQAEFSWVNLVALSIPILTRAWLDHWEAEVAARATPDELALVEHFFGAWVDGLMIVAMVMIPVVWVMADAQLQRKEEAAKRPVEPAVEE